MIRHLDHLVLTTLDEAACARFYVGVLGMRLETFGAGRKAFRFGDQKINLHVPGQDIALVADRPQPGALDLCFLAAVSLAQVIDKLREAGIAIIEGPVVRTGATGPIRSVYVRDPDRNLIEISEPVRS